jgi:hypothetical protein
VISELEQKLPLDTLWLGYDGLDLPFADIVAVMRYQPAFDGRLTASFGSVPFGVEAVVVTASGAYLPARWRVEHLRRRWAFWRQLHGSVSH